ncbi:MAG TPA: trypsin-like peptidase domain-containing protein [Armatimonadota bacterium]|nr:trypsin-like peptidase domain-containing protein [Armatimonadota bacterium]
MRPLTVFIACIFSILNISVTAFTQDVKPELIFQQSLPSVMTVITDTGSGTGFAALKDGVIITAWHVVDGAKKVTARFSNGEEFESQGLIDKDEQHDVAIFRIKKYGTPLLPFSKDDPPIGSTAYTIGAPLGLDFTFSNGIISQIKNLDGKKYFQFTCPASPGNSGGPLLNSKGEVLGLVDCGVIEGQNLNFAVPMTYVLALDPTLRPQPWDKVSSTTTSSTTSNHTRRSLKPITTDEELDQCLGEAVNLYLDMNAIDDYVNEAIGLRNSAYRRGIPSFVYMYQRKLPPCIQQLQAYKSTSQERENLRKSLTYNLGLQLERLNGRITAIKQAQKDDGWTAEANDLDAQAGAVFADYDENMYPDIAVLGKVSPTFTHNIFIDFQYYLHLAAKPSCLEFGAAFLHDSPTFFAGIDSGTFAEKIGLKPGDTLIAIDDKDFTSVGSQEPFKQYLAERLGKTVKIHVERGGQKIFWRVTLPKKK